MSLRLLLSRFSTCLFVLFTLCVLAGTGHAQVSITFQGHVKYSTGEPVVGATVTMTVRDDLTTVGTETTTTDGSGNYTFQSSRSESAMPSQ